MMKDIILFLSDQHTQNVIGFENPLVDTPFLDQMADSGSVYTHCMCNAPLCVPSRMSFLSGQYPSDLQIWNNDTTLPIDVPTIAHALGAQGYKTVLIGRMHFKGDDQLHGFDEHLGLDITSQYWGKVSGKDEEYGAFASTTQMKHCQSNVGAGYSPVNAYDDHILEVTLDYLKQKEDQPHFIVIGFYGPHFPYACSSDLYQKYQKRIKEDDSLSQIAHPIYQAIQQASTPKHVANIKAAYYGMIEQLDRRIATIYEKLQAQQKHETVYLYTSDHGEQCGRRQCFGKQTLYEDALKVPLIIWGSNIPKQVIDSPVSLLDVSKTILRMGDTDLVNHQGHCLFGEELEENLVYVQHCIDSQGLKIIEALYYKQYKLVQLQEELILYDIKRDYSESDNIATQCPVIFEQLKLHLLTEQEKMNLTNHEMKQQLNHGLLKKWGNVKQPKEFARFINPSTACDLAQE